MSLTLPAAKAELIEALEVNGYAVAGYVPPAIEPPLVIMSTGDPYLVKGDTLGTEAIANLELFLVFEAAEGQEFTDAADAALAKLLVVVMSTGEGWEFEGCSAPFNATNAGGRPTCRVRVSAPVSLKEG